MMLCWFRADMVSALIAAGADVNARETDGTTPLMLAITEDYPESVRVLIKAGADVNARNDQGQSALALALRAGTDTESIRLLREAGAVQ